LLLVYLDKCVVFFVFEIVEFVEVFIFEAILVGTLLGVQKCFLNYRGR
jgi:hypothetical protein